MRLILFVFAATLISISEASVVGSVGDFWTLLLSLNAERVKEIAANQLWLALIVCFASGILTSLTPCVYPMIPITINIFGRYATHSSTRKTGAFDIQTFFVALVYVAGMCFTYSTMGLLAGLTGSLFGQVLQNPWMIGALTLIFFSLGLGQLGLFKVALPASWQTKLASVGNSKSLVGIFLMGLFSGLIVSPCVGPVIAGILAFVFDSSNAVIGLLYFFSFSCGLGVLFLLIGGFSSLLNRLPRSGTWMMRVNRTLAALMFVATAYYGHLWLKQVGWIAPSGIAQQNGEWITQPNEALKLAAAQNKPIVMDFTAEWCEACHVIEATVFSDPKVQKELAQHWIKLRIDATHVTPEIDEILKKYAVLGLPSILFLNSSGELFDSPRFSGAMTPDEFLNALHQVVR